MDTIRDAEGRWWWLDTRGEWRRARLWVIARWRAHRARRAELRAEVYGWDIRGGKWR